MRSFFTSLCGACRILGESSALESLQNTGMLTCAGKIGGGSKGKGSSGDSLSGGSHMMTGGETGSTGGEDISGGGVGDGTGYGLGEEEDDDVGMGGVDSAAVGGRAAGSVNDGTSISAKSGGGASTAGLITLAESGADDYFCSGL